LRVPFPIRLILLDLITPIIIIICYNYINEVPGYEMFFELRITSSLFGQNFIFNNLFLKVLNLCSFLRLKDQILQPCKTTDNNTVLYTLIFRFPLKRR
jgi:hypothetical protein